MSVPSKRNGPPAEVIDPMIVIKTSIPYLS
jgi:hypothetical protein